MRITIPNYLRVALLAIAALTLASIMACPAHAAFPNGYSFCKLVTVKTYNGGSGGMVSGGSDLLNFPVLISVTDPNLAVVGSGGGVQNSSGYDIVFDNSTTCSGAGAALNWELERYVPTTGEILAWAKFPTLHASSDDKISMYYGKAGISTFQSSAANAWDANYKFVLHAPDGTTLSSVNSVTGTGMTNVGATATTGKLGGGVQFTSASSTYLNMADTAAMQLERTDSVTWEGWLNPTSFPSYPMVIQKMAGGPTYRGWQVFVDSSISKIGAVLFSDTSTGAQISRTASATLATSTWTHFAITYDGSSTSSGFHVYLNGVLSDAAADGVSISTTTLTTDPINVGRRGNPSSLYWNGKMDEIRMSKGVARSAGWIATAYRNQNTPGTYTSFGTQLTGPVVSSAIRHSVRSGE